MLPTLGGRGVAQPKPISRLQILQIKKTTALETNCNATAIAGSRDRLSMHAQKFRPSEYVKIKGDLIQQLLGSRCLQTERWTVNTEGQGTASISNPLDQIYEPDILYPVVYAYSQQLDSGVWYQLDIREYYVGKLKICLPYEGVYAIVVMDAVRPSILLLEYNHGELTITCKTICTLHN